MTIKSAPDISSVDVRKLRDAPDRTIIKYCHEHGAVINQMLIIVWPQLPLAALAYFNKGSD